MKNDGKYHGIEKFLIIRNWFCVKSRHRLRWCPTCQKIKYYEKKFKSEEKV